MSGGDALLSMDQSRWLSCSDVPRGALRRHNFKYAARSLTEYQDHCGWCCRIARRAARRPPRAQAIFKTSSNSAVQRQVFPLGLPTFRPFLRPAFILFPARWCCLVVLDAPRTAAEFRHSPDWLSTEISSSRPGKSDLDLPGNMILIALTTAV